MGSTGQGSVVQAISRRRRHQCSLYGRRPVVSAAHRPGEGRFSGPDVARGRVEGDL